jgi:syntaxin 8
MSKPNQLFLLADHIKLSLLERQRAQSHNLDADDSRDGHISRSLEQFREGLDGLKDEELRLRESGNEEYVVIKTSTTDILKWLLAGE